MLELPKVGTHVYAQHWSTNVWVCCFSIDRGPVQTWVLGDPMPPAIREAIRRRYIFVAHGAMSFEFVMWRDVLTSRQGWDAPPPPELWSCTMCRGLVLGLPRKLEAMAAIIGTPHQKDMKAHRVMLQLARPRSIDAEGKPIWWDDPHKYAVVGDYCRSDVRAETGLDDALPELSDAEREVWLIDAEMNERGIYLDEGLIAQSTAAAVESAAALDERMDKLTGGAVTKCSQRDRLVQWCATQGVQVGTLRKQALEDALLVKAAELPPPVLRALRLRLEAAKSSVAKLAAFKRHRCSDGRMRDNLQYHAAGTGRWGGKGAQLQNLPRGLAVDVDTVIEDLLAGVDGLSLDMLHDVGALGAISSALRGCLTAAPGRDLIAGDFKTVEARGCAWLTDHSALLAMFARDAEVYKWMASLIYGVAEDEVEPIQRQLGKQCVLACGFGVGPSGFHAKCHNDGLRISVSEAEHAVYSWREANKPIVDGWYILERAARTACATPGVLTQCFGGRVMFYHNGSHLFARLPNGRRLTYWRARIAWDEEREREQVEYEGVNAYTKQWSVERIWGGKWMENVVQAMCRDLLADAMRRLRHADYPLVLSVHDEIIAEVFKEFGSVDEFEKLMCASEPWAYGFPVSAKAWRAERYHK